MLNRILAQAGSDTFKYFPVRLVPALTSLITVPVFTRMIAREEYGYFALITSAVSLASVIAIKWVHGSIIRLYWTYERQDRHDEYVSTAIWSAAASLAVVAAVAGGAVYLAQDSLAPGLARLAPLGVLSLSVNYLAASILQILRAGNRSTRFSQLSVGTTLVGTAISLLLVVVADMGAAGILLGMVLGNALILPFALVSVRTQGRLSPRLVRRDIASEFLSYGLPFVPAAVSSWLLVLADRYIIEFLRSTAEVGLYTVNYSLGDRLMQLVVAPFLVAVAPVLVKTFEKEGEELTQRAQTELTRYYGMVTIPLLFGLASIARHFVTVFTGPEYHEGYRALPLVACGVLVYGMVQIAGNGITLHRKTAIIMQNAAAAAAFNVVANLLLVGRYGYMAAAATTIASYLLLLGLAWWRGRHFMAWIPPFKELGRITLAASIMAAVLIAAFGRMSPSLWLLAVQVATGIAVYLGALKLLGGIKDEEVRFVRELARRLRRRS